MTIDMLIVAPLVVGHVSLFVLSLNLMHSTAIPERAARRASTWRC